MNDEQRYAIDHPILTADGGNGKPIMRDLGRFRFGISVNL